MTKRKAKGFGVKETYPEIEGLGQLISPIKYVIFQPAKDDYLAREEGNDALILSAWCPTPNSAKKFPTLSKAEAKAKEISADKGYVLQVCELYETSKKFATNIVAEVNG